MQFDCHMHTPLCGHSRGDPQEFVDQAANRGIGLITFTCHIPMNRDDFGQEGTRMRPHQLTEYVQMIQNAAQYGKNLGVEVLTGIEAEIFPDSSVMKEMEHTLAEFPFDFVLGSLHHMLPSYRVWLRENGKISDSEIITSYFQHLGDAAESGRYHSLAHPDVIRVYGTLRKPFQPQEHQNIIETFLDRVAKSGTCLEINTSGRIKGDFVEHPDPQIMEWAAQRDIPFTIGSDSHLPDRVGADFEAVLEEAANRGLKNLNFFRNAQRNTIPLTEFLHSTKAKAP